MGTALIFVSMPVFWLGLLVLFLFANDIGRFRSCCPAPTATWGSPSTRCNWFTSLLMPWFVLAATSAAIYSRVLRGSLIEAMGEDYIRTARAKGLRERRVVLRHGVRSAITPVVTILGLDIGALLGGAVITETVFDIPGIGRLNFDAINHSDFPIVQGTVILAALFIVIANIIVDIALRLSRPARPVLVSRDCIEHHERAAALRRGPARLVPHRRRRRARRRRDLLRRRGGQDAGIVGESGSGKSVSSLTTLGLTRSKRRRSRAGSSSRARTWSRWTTTSCAGPRQRRVDDLPGPAVRAAPVLQGRQAAGGGDAGPPRHLQVRRRAPARRSCSSSSASPIPSAASTSTRTSSPAACASAR